MNLNTLHLFAQIVQDGSLSKTAERTGVPIATISRQIAELEKSVQIQLFDRQKTGVKPTLAGQQLFEKTYQSLDNLTQITEHFGEKTDELSGTLRIAMVAGMHEIVEWIDEFCELNQKVSVNIQTSDRLVDLVADGIDVAFRMGELHADNIVAKKLPATQVKWLAHPDILAKFGTPNTWDDLKNFPCVGYVRGSARILTIPNGKKPLQLPYVFASNDTYLIENAIKNGRGVGALSAHTAERFIRDFGLVEILADLKKDEFAVHLLYVKHRYQTAVMTAFLAFMDKKIAEKIVGN